MTVKTTLSFTDRHHQYLSEKVGQGVFATRSATVAAAIEQIMQDETERNVALSALAEIASPVGQNLAAVDVTRDVLSVHAVKTLLCSGTLCGS